MQVVRVVAVWDLQATLSAGGRGGRVGGWVRVTSMVQRVRTMREDMERAPTPLRWRIGPSSSRMISARCWTFVSFELSWTTMYVSDMIAIRALSMTVGTMSIKTMKMMMETKAMFGASLNHAGSKEPNIMS